MTLRHRFLGAAAAAVLAACAAPSSPPPAPAEALDGTAANYVVGPPDGAVTSIEVEVLDGSGRPAPGARVVVGARYAVSSGMCGLVGAEKAAEGMADGSGRCVLAVRLSGAVAGIRAAACAGDQVGASGWAEDPGAGPVALTVRLGSGVRPRGIVLDTGGNPVPGAAVEAWYGGGNLRVFRGAAVAGKDGTFVLPPLPRAAADDLQVDASEPNLGSGGVSPGADDPLDALRIVLTYPPPFHGGPK